MTTRTKAQSVAPPGGNNGFSLISNEKQLQLYVSMVKGRMIEERARLLMGEKQFTDNDDATLGREATVVGVAIDLRPEDTVSSSNRDLTCDFIRGVPLDKLFSRSSDGAAEPSIAARLKFATNAAQANKAEKNGKIGVVFSDSGFASPAYLHEGLTLAGAQRLPMVFVSHINFSTEPGRLNSQIGAGEIAAQVCGVPVIAVDSNDVVAIYRVATEAIAHARKGNGPTLIECLIECMVEGTQIDQAVGDGPILNMETYLVRKGLFSAEMKREVAAGFAKELDAAVEAAEGRSSPRASRRF